MHKKMTDIMKTNFNFRIYQTTLKDTEQKFLVPSNCDLKIPLAYAELWRIMNSLQKCHKNSQNAETIVTGTA